MHTPILMFAFVLGACTSALGVDDFSGPSPDPGGPGDPGPGTPDQPGAPVPFSVGGTLIRVADNGVESNLQSYPLYFVKMPERLRVAGQGTDANGKFEFVAETHGEPAAGYIEIPIQITGHLMTFVHDSRFAGSVQRDVRVMSHSRLDTLASAAGDPHRGTPSMVQITVLLADGSPAAGAVVSIQPAAVVRYANPNGTLSSTAIQTSSRGEAWAFNAGTGKTTISVQLPSGQIAPFEFEVYTELTHHQIVLRP